MTETASATRARAKGARAPAADLHPSPVALHPGDAIGVDIGGVLAAHGDRSDDTSFFGDRYLESPEVPGAFEGVRRLREAGLVVSLVSKCHARTQRKTREWLQAHEFEARTGLSAWDVWFCRERPEKAEIASVLHLDGFIDDRRDVLDLLPKRVRTRLWFAPDWSRLASHGSEGSSPPVEAIPTPDWAAALRQLL